MKMDQNSTDQSPPFGDNGSVSWHQSWDIDDSSISGLNIEHSPELSGLVEDKDVAAQAVAFVVNSTRKGIVPLCADVANLMRSKISLESKVQRLRGENDALRKSLQSCRHASTSTSPTPGSITSYDNRAQSDRLSPCLCSRCSSQCSSLVSNSPKLYHQRSPRLHRTSAFSVPAKNTQNVLAVVHPTPPNGFSQHSVPESKVKEHQRKNSLPEMVSEPHGNVPKVSPRVKKLSVEVQCSLDPVSPAAVPSLEQQFKDSLQANSKLTDEVCGARKEIQQLQAKLKETLMIQLARQYSDEFHVESETDSPRNLKSVQSLCVPTSTTEGSTGILLSTGSIAEKTSSDMRPVIYNGARLKTPSPVMIGGYLLGCKCSNCEKLSAESESHKLKKSASGSTLQIELEDHIVIRGDKAGRVKYVGHLDNVGQPNMVFVGVQLDAPVGRHNGVVNGKRYFSCDKDCGLVVPLTEVVCVVSKQAAAPRSVEPHARAPRICRSLSERADRERRRWPVLRTERRSEPLNLKLPKDDQLQSGHLV